MHIIYWKVNNLHLIFLFFPMVLCKATVALHKILFELELISSCPTMYFPCKQT